MRILRPLLRGMAALSVLAVVSAAALAADPGLVYQVTSEVSDQKAGSVLFYNVYTSSATAPATSDSRINITNTSTTSAAFVHLYFVDGSTCSVADSFICLTTTQTASVLASDTDPGTTGYVVAIAVDGVIGCPRSFNFLIGTESVRFATGHTAKLGAEAFSALYTGSLPGCDANSVTATVPFNGVTYNLAPRVLASASVPSPADGNDSLLIVNRVGGNLLTSASTIGNIFGLFYDDAENTFSYTFSGGNCQFRSSISDAFPRTVPRISSIIPAGRTGWTKFWSTADIALLGAQIDLSTHGGPGGGVNLHKLTLSAGATLIVPVFAPAC